MGFFTRDIRTIDDLFNHVLRDIYYAAHQIGNTLQKMTARASDAQLRALLEANSAEIETAIQRLGETFAAEGAESRGVTCEAIDGIISEANHVMGDIAVREVLDAAMLASAQAMEHYMMTRHATLATWAEQRARRESQRLLAENWTEAAARDERLAALAKVRIGKLAA